MFHFYISITFSESLPHSKIIEDAEKLSVFGKKDSQH